MIKEENGRNLSDLSKFLKKLRIDHSEFLGDMADKLEISAAHLSSVESGRKTVPADFADKITTLYGLSAEEKTKLETFIAKSNREVSVNLKSIPLGKDLSEYASTAVMFAKDISKLDTDHLKQIQAILMQCEQNRGNHMVK